MAYVLRAGESGAALGAFEHHVFEKVAHTRHFRRFVACSSACKEAKRDGLRRRIIFPDDLQPIW